METYIRTDGGRSNYFKGTTGDCVVRAIALASDMDYKEVYNALKKRMPKGSSPRNGVPKKIYHSYIIELGFEWVSYMGIGTGCKVHLRKDELPKGTIICRLSKHLTCVKNHVLYDMYHPGINRCVYGVYKKVNE